METGKGEGLPLMSRSEAAVRLQELAGDKPLNHQQLSAAVEMVASEDRFIMVQGRAGSGKSTMLQPVAKLEALHAAGQLLQSAGVTPLLLTVDMKSNAKALAFQNKMVADLRVDRSEEHTSELQSLMRISYDVF